jgi:hypothetical protein
MRRSRRAGAFQKIAKPAGALTNSNLHFLVFSLWPLRARRPIHSAAPTAARAAPIKIVGLLCDLAGHGWLIIAKEFFSIKNEAPPGNKTPNREIKPMQRSSRSMLCALRAPVDFTRESLDPDRRQIVRSTKIILLFLLLVSAITSAFANPPGGSYIQYDPKNPRSPVRCTPDGW